MLTQLKMILFLFAFGNLQEVQSATCTFESQRVNYVCRLRDQAIESENDMQVDGVHLEGYSDSDVGMLTATNSSVQVFPSLIIDTFKNLRTVSLWSTSMKLF